MVLPRYKEITDLIKKGATIEAQEKIMELREAALALEEENIELKNKVKELEDKLNTKANVVWESPYYWSVNGDEKDGPYCQNCYDGDGKLIRLQQPGREGYWECHTCGKHVMDASYEHDDEIVSVGRSSTDWDSY